jgi:hypothetical protein
MRPSPRVRCEGCDFAWFGVTAAHGLRVIGSCPRCGGSLSFLSEEDFDAPETDERLRDVAPADVLGRPTTWH